MSWRATPMFKTGAAALLALAAVFPSLSRAEAFDQGMDTLWEVLWHQSGTATRVVRWEEDLKVRVYGASAATKKAHTLKALRDVAAEAGLKVIDVSDAADAAQQANVSIEIVPDSQLSEAQPCETRLNFGAETKIDSVTMQMRESEEWRCAYHESMHVMGVRGHPEGSTVLSYFATKVEGLQPLDKAMLRAWYSPRARGGMTPFEMLPILADELVAILPDKAKAKQSRDRYLSRTVQEMQAFAQGQGDIPMIVKRCGKSTEQGIRYGRMEMSYFLGVAYLQGASVARNDTQAVSWLQRAANLGSRPALAQLGAAGASLAGKS
ncbi:hypothetical protein H8N03_09920 [Ramlibacter sp. USB13]|uniref:DUF2268 domain-containing protein n=1 Tax=Ramlibacter cellulosilyticus TaxID=2764187 RepID=A0A923MQT7_9BURK|nr:hypothetical protein [Ramlibacter cellulosilyticus]MBC5783261.1 hypothetical protein [Ramlibacter cellulosilyticus]